MIRFSLFDSAINWLCLVVAYWYGYLDSFMFILHTKYLLQKSSQHFSEFPIVCLIWYAWMKSSVMFKQQDTRWCGFRWSIPLSIDYVRNSCIDMAISILSCSYCICNRYRQNHRSILPEIPIVCMILYGWIQSSAMFKQQDLRWYGSQWSILISIDYVWSVSIHGLSRLLDIHIAYEIAI